MASQVRGPEIQNAVEFKESISLCMVCKDEGKTLRKAVESVEDLCDEIIIGVDRTSSDDTADIAREIADVYFEFDFEDNFAQARNQAIDKATGTLIFILDGHEFIAPDDHPALEIVSKMYGRDPANVQIPTSINYIEHLLIKGMDKQFKVLCFNLCMNVGDDDTPQLFFIQPRVFRNNCGIRYDSTVHNYLIGYGKEDAAGAPEVILIHNMPPDREKKRAVQRKKMNVSGLYKDIKDNPDNGRAYFYLGNTHADMGNPKKAIHWYERYLKRSAFGEEKYQALQQLALLHWRHNNDEVIARKFLVEAITINHRRREPYILLGEIAFKGEDWDQALHWFHLAKQIVAPVSVMFCQGAAYSYLPDLMMMQCYEKLKDYDNALHFCGQALIWRPKDAALIGKREEFKVAMREKMEKANSQNFLILDGLGSFTSDMARYLSDNFNVTRQTALTDRWRMWSDFAWLEWVDNNTMEASIRQWDCPVVCRLHSYEAFTEMPASVNWKNINHLVFVAEHIRQLAFKRWVNLPDLVETSIIPNGVHVDRYKFKERQHGKKIAYLGYMNPKKNPQLIIDAARMYPDYEFHIAGGFQDNHLFYQMNEAFKSTHNIWYYGTLPKEDVDEWLEDKNYLFSPSIVESFGFSIAEAMCKGIKPLIAERPGAIWHDTFSDVGDLGRLLENEYDSHAYRLHIAENFHITRQMTLTAQLITRLLDEHAEKGPDLVKYNTITELEMLPIMSGYL